MRSIAAFTLIFAFCAPVAGADSVSKFKPWTGGATPRLVLKDLAGKRHDLARYRGKLVVINFWATWCAPCIKEMPSLQQLSMKFAQQGLVVLTVNFGETPERITPFVDKLGLRTPVLLDPDMDMSRNWVEKGLPTSYVIDPAQKIRYLILGEVDWADAAVEAKIRELLPKP